MREFDGGRGGSHGRRAARVGGIRAGRLLDGIWQAHCHAGSRGEAHRVGKPLFHGEILPKLQVPGGACRFRNGQAHGGGPVDRVGRVHHRVAHGTGIEIVELPVRQAGFEAAVGKLLD